MSSFGRNLAVLSCAIILLAMGMASADLVYQGETTDRTTYTPQFSGDSASDLLWDYSYQLTDWSGSQGDPDAFAIFTSYEVTNVWLSDDSNWDWTWDSEITGDEPNYGSALNGSWFDDKGKQALVFYLADIFPDSDPEFHFQTAVEPKVYHYTLGNGTSGPTVEDVEWTAAPEPTTMLLTSIGIIGLGALRRRQKA
jgi:hypothetical protein